MLWLALACPATAQVVISEFMAADQRRLADEDGDYEDWIELYNPGSDAVDLADWALTDNPDRLTKWRFPATRLAPGEFLIVFASDKDRRVAGRPLHTNFKLGSTGEYLGLVKADGRTVASEFAPVFPPQAPSISYGVPIRTERVSLVARGAPGRFQVPPNDDWGTRWTAPEFDDRGWIEVANGVGFEASGTVVLVPVADSVGDWSPSGVQGFRGWSYGYYNKAKDTVSGYQSGDFIPFPRSDAPYGVNNYWNGTLYRWPAATTPWDSIGQTEMYPNGTASGGEHWVIRRWQSPVAGDFQVRWRIAKAGVGGAGVTGKLFHNGLQRDTFTIAGGEVTGVTRTVALSGVKVGDAIDLLLTPIGVGGATDDRSDATHLSMTVLGPGTLADFIATDVQGPMRGVNASAYLRLPFQVTDSAELSRLSLDLRYADGFVAYLNGFEVARRNAPAPAEPLTWQSTATASRTPLEASERATLDLTPYRDFLVEGTNVLAFHGLNQAADADGFLIEAELTGSRVRLELGRSGYFTTPTPGTPNGQGSQTIGPLIGNARHVPDEPTDAEDLRVEAEVTPTLQAVGAVTLYYRVMYGAEVALEMRDDGLGGDTLAGDRIYTATIPAAVSSPGQMVRYYIVAADREGHELRWPEFADTRNSPQYHGTVVANPALTETRLPVLHWFIERPTAADSDTPARCSLYFAGEFYDNTGVTVHGQSTRGFPKKSYDFDFNPGYKFQWSPDAPRVDDFNLLTTWADKSHLRNVLAHETYRDAGAPAHFAFPVRVQQNGAFFSVANLVENGDDNFLRRLGLDPNGALYKMYNSAESASGNEKKTRKSEGTADLQALISGMSQANATARQTFMFDNLDLPVMIDFLAAKIITADVDCCHKNYYLYRDTNGSGQWQAMPWDVDLSFGRVWTCGSPCLAYYDETIYTNQSILTGSGNTVFTPIYSTPATRQMFLRRLRTLMDRWLQPPGTPAASDFYRLKSLELRDRIAPDAARDLAKWGTWGRRETITQAVDRIWNEFLPGRRRYLFNTLSVTNRGEIPVSQPTNALVQFGLLEFRPASGLADQEWLSLTNPNTYAVDISDWRLDGGARFTFKGGTVIPARSNLYVTPNLKAFRTRTVSPKGGERRLVTGPYQGNLSAWGESLALLDPAGRLVASNSFTGDPSPAQRYLRITEIMFHPAPAPGDVPERDEFEYLELANVGPVELDLRGVAFTEGIQFAFSSGAIGSLPPGGRVLVVKNPVAFALRYGPGLPVAGAYVGSLDNSGERLRLEDAFGEKILEFEYDDRWQALADGLGFSLAVVNEQAHWSTWSAPDQWRLDGTPGGTPGAPNALPPLIAPVVINELLAHTQPPMLDALELHNPTGQAVDLGGWFLTDDLEAPKKFRIPSPTRLEPGGFLAFTEAQFNPVGGGPDAFALGADGDDLWLLSGDARGNLTGYLQGTEFGATESGVSLGRWVNSAGEVDYAPQVAVTLDQPNAGPRVGPVVLSEIMYHPPPVGTNELPLSFIELANLASTNVPLFHPAEPTNTWRLRNAVDFGFPRNTALPPAGRLLVVGFDPAGAGATLAAFRQHYGLPGDVPILGPWQGRLGNADQVVELEKPDRATTNGVPFVLVERVHYWDRAPWPAEADGTGASLQRVRLEGYGNEPTNWFAAPPTPGAPNVPNAPPSVALTQPVDGATFGVPGDVRLAASALDSDGYILRVEFWGDGVELGADTQAPFEWVWPAVPPGKHTVLARAVDDRFGTATTHVSFTVETPPPGVAITAPPTQTVLMTGSAVALRAEASQAGGSIRRVQFRVGNTQLAELTVPPYALVWSNATAGVFPLTAVATAADGRAATSTVVTVAFSRGVITNLVLVPKGARWRYLVDGSNPDAAWRTPGFADAAWPSGPAELGYGDEGEGRPEATRIGYGPDAGSKYITTYFRHSFTVLRPHEFTGLTVNLLRDDGAIVYLNGVEVFRTNLPEGDVDYLTPAEGAVAGTEETVFHPMAVSPLRLRDGTNTLAVEVHQSSGGSSDLSFDLELNGTRALLAPVVLAPPENRMVAVGGTAAFEVVTGGSEPLAYEWRFKGTPIPGATQRRLELTNVQLSDAGVYSVRVQNAIDFAVSAPATLTVVAGEVPAPGQLAIEPASVGYRLRFAAQPGQRWALERSTNLVEWTTLTVTSTPEHGLIEYEDLDPAETNAFYRAAAR